MKRAEPITKIDATAAKARTNVSFCCFNHGIAARKPTTTMTTGENHSTHRPIFPRGWVVMRVFRSEEHTSELQSLMRNSYADFCLKKKSYKHFYTVNKQLMHSIIHKQQS